MNTIREIKYKGYLIKFFQDEFPINPFEEWEQPPLMYKGPRHSENDFSDGEIDNYLTSYLTLNQITRNQAKILEFIGMDFSTFNRYYSREEYSREDRAQALREELDNTILYSIESRAKFCELFNIPYYFGTAIGYSQGEWANVLTILTPDYISLSGIKPKYFKDNLECNFKLFQSWMFGDTFGYTINDPEGREIESIWSYFGEIEDSGAIESAKAEIEANIRQRTFAKIKKLKALILAKLPLFKRQLILNNI